MEESKPTRVAQPAPPLPCYGLELSLQDPMCQRCPHQAGCVVASKSRADKVPLNLSVVKLKNPSEKLSVVQDDLSAYYQVTAQRLLNQRVNPLTPAEVESVAAQADELGVEPRLYILSVLTGHLLTSPDRRHYASHLTGPIAVKRVQLYRNECARKYGLFDAQALANISGAESQVVPQIEDSEFLACSYVIGHKLSFANGALSALYSTRELGLDPRWLATEPSYLNWLNMKPESTPELEKHRRQVKSAERWSAQLTMQREPVVLRCLEKALLRYNVKLDDFYGPPTITRAANIWLRVGDALNRLRDLEAVTGLVSLPTSSLSYE